jgi:hypothetical protein
LSVDLARLVRAVLGHRTELAPDEHRVVVVRQGDRPELVAHAPLAHHLARQLGRALDVVLRARRDVADHQLLGHAAAEEHAEVREDLPALQAVRVLLGELHGEAERHAARDDRHLMQRVVALHQQGAHGMAAFMHHGGYIVQLSCCIHKYKWGAAFSQRAIITTRSFALSAFKIQ